MSRPPWCPPEFLTVRQLADWTGLQRSSVQNAIEAGRLKAERAEHVKRWIIHRDEARRWIESRRRR